MAREHGQSDGEQYESPSRIVQRDGVLEARIDGSDGRTAWLSTSGWPAPNLHLPFLRAFVHSTGPGTRRRTSLHARTIQWKYQELLRFLAHRHGPDVVLNRVTADDVRSYMAQIPDISSRVARLSELRALTRALFELELCERGLFEAASEYGGRAQTTPAIGYVPPVFADIVAAATRDVEALVERLSVGESLLQRFRDNPGSLSAGDRVLGAMLDETATTGSAPRGGRVDDGTSWWKAVPRMLFPSLADMTPLMVLLAARTGLNSETLKELSASHQIREGLFVETQTIKRRRGFESESVAWEIGGPTRRLKTAGGMYLLLHELCRRSREFAGSGALLCAWSQSGGGRNQYPWTRRLGGQGVPDLPGWARMHELVEDGEQLRLTFGRIKTTIDRDRAQKNDFDLDRAAVTNTPTVLYRSYVSPDPTARRALESITNTALTELDARLTIVQSPEKHEQISARAPITSEPDAVSTAFMQCRDLLGHPDQQGVECTATFLDCFKCPCAVVSDENIPTIMRLSEELVERFDRLPLEAWVRLYGQAWLAINNDILPSRSSEELAHFAAAMPESTALTLLEEPEMF